MNYSEGENSNNTSDAFDEMTKYQKKKVTSVFAKTHGTRSKFTQHDFVQDKSVEVEVISVSSDSSQQNRYVLTVILLKLMSLLLFHCKLYSL